MSVILNEINYFWKLGFNEETPDLYVKRYPCDQIISIDVDQEKILYGDRVRIENERKAVFSQTNFIILEAIDRFLTKEYRPDDIVIGRSGMYDFHIENVNIAVNCLEFEDEYDAEVTRLKEKPSRIHAFFEKNKDIELFCAYTSRLKAGLIEYRYVVFSRAGLSQRPEIYLGGFFETGIPPYNPNIESFREGTEATKRSIGIIGDFHISNGILMKYTGKYPEVGIPEGVKKIGNAVFWGLPNLVRVTIADSVTQLGGDTFYNCENLSELTIPRNVEVIGDNPFANCPKLDLVNESPHFNFENGGLYDRKMTRLIYFAINHDSEEVVLPGGLISIGKHSFYNCQNLRRIVIPKSVRIIENNPFSNLSRLRIENNSPHFIHIDGVLYNKTMSTLFYYEHGNELKELVIPEGVSIIGRHSFYNCQTIKTITIPSSVKMIGYNPFTNCSNLSLVNHSPEFVYEDGVLYNRKKTELIYFSIPNPVESFTIPDNVRKIGRCAFFGGRNLKRVVISKGVSIIERSAFAKCTNLKEVSMPDSINTIGEWAFSDCLSLKHISIPKHTSIGSHTFLNSPTEIYWREADR